MEYLVKVGEQIVLSEDTTKAIITLENKIKELKDTEDVLRQQILKEMEEKNIIKVDNGDLAITYVAETYKETFDSKTFKKDNESLYNQYVKISPVKASIRIKVK